MSTTRPGTLRWAAPEYFSTDEQGTERTIKSDIYSFGNMTLLVRTRWFSPWTVYDCDSRQVLSGKYPWSEVQADAAIMFQLSLGRNPGRPRVPPIDDRHWAFIQRCWSSIPERPVTKEVVSSLQRLLGAYPPPPTLYDLLEVPTSLSSVPNCFEPDNAMPVASPPDPAQSRILTDTRAFASPPSSDIPTSSPDHVPRSSPPALTIDTQPLAFQDQQQGIVNELGEEARGHSEDHSPERPPEAHSNNMIVAHGLPTCLNESQVHAFLQAFGNIKTCKLIRENDGNGPSKVVVSRSHCCLPPLTLYQGIAFFEYADASVTDVAVRSLNGMELVDRSLVVHRVNDDTRWPPLHERKLRGEKPARANKDDSKVPGPSTRTRHRVRAKETVSQKKLVTKKPTTDAPSDSPRCGYY